MLKYRCLVLDHDDTVVKSTKEIHFPSFKRTIAEVKPQLKITEEDFVTNCFDPGFFEYMEKILGFTEAEMTYQLESWLKYIEDKIPAAYDGIAEVIHRQREEGGLVCVVSHSYSEIIKRDYTSRFGCLPDRIYGGEEPEERRKPSVFPILDIMCAFSLDKKDIAVVDDLLPGLKMATAAGVDFMCAGWSHSVKKIADIMRAESGVYLESTGELYARLFG